MHAPAESIRILIADDHPIFRDGLRKLLEAERGFEVIGEAGDGADAVRLEAELRPDVLLLDLNMPGLSGIEALEALARRASPVRAIVLAAAIEGPQIVKAFQLGARGVVLKASATQLLYTCLRSVMAGEYWVGRESVADIVQALQQAQPQETSRSAVLRKLTPREQEVVAAIAGGATNKEVARRLGLSQQTVKNHLSSIFERCGVSNRLELAVLALRGEPSTPLPAGAGGHLSGPEQSSPGGQTDGQSQIPRKY